MEGDAGLVEYLSGFVLPERRARLRDVLSRRTNHITVVLEDIYDPHNASAVLRSCEAMGIQSVHIVQMRHRFHLKEGVAMGTGKWLSLATYSSTAECFDHLRSSGYRICAASPPVPGAVELPACRADQKTAIVLGSEKDGLSDFARSHCDTLVTIPMAGFAESFNLSVSAAILIYSLRQSFPCPPLTEEEARAVELDWLKASVRNSEELLAHYRAGRR